jgi:hypothetical protein
MLIVLGSALIQDRAQVPSPADQRPVGDLGPGRPYPASGIGVRRGRGGIFTTSIPAPDSTAPNA